ncbi:MAG TPA: urea ABC transporter ATP-binding subunit UrtE [Phycisphaerae bacterium]|nr:urea ABC transporter ATP-binding subunit UrtE [Phycisphaerae bacterium]
MLTLCEISYSYGAVRALSSVSMDMRPGEITCVMGRNGVGKTTLMRNIMGTLRSELGQILLGDRDVTGLAPHKRAKAGIALVPQGRQIFPKLTVMENLSVGCAARRDGKKIIPEELYELFPILKTMGKRMGGDLSGGQQQQLAIARALVGEPEVLLLDEPTEGIQPNIIQQIGQVLKKLVTERRMTVVLVEQYLDFVREFGQRFYIMNRGRVVADGATPALSSELVKRHLSV